MRISSRAAKDFKSFVNFHKLLKMCVFLTLCHFYV